MLGFSIVATDGRRQASPVGQIDIYDSRDPGEPVATSVNVIG